VSENFDSIAGVPDDVGIGDDLARAAQRLSTADGTGSR
jgi:hypothetical protein